MKKVSVFLVGMMLLSVFSGFAYAETPMQQPEIKATVKPIIEVDGFYFKDLNANGKLDVYEDWRADIDDRVADLISQMTLEELVGVLFCINRPNESVYPVTWDILYNQDGPIQVEGGRGPSYSAWYVINEFHNSCMLDNANGAPEEHVFIHNEIQKMSEATRLGVPMTFANDREYNAWGGYVDKPHAAFGTANAPELSEKLYKRYAQAMESIGIHVTFEPYGNEIGAFNGEDPEYIAKQTELEVRTLNENGLATCVKHWIGRGGDSSFENARSVAQNVENWLEGWKAAVESGTPWIMTNSGAKGLSNTVAVEYDKATMDYLRETLGFDGVVVTDWWPFGLGSKVTGVTVEGVDLYEANVRELYRIMLEYGTDLFGSGNYNLGEGEGSDRLSGHYPEAIVNGVRDGDIDKFYVERAAARILRFKFERGLFENPYVDAERAIAINANINYDGKPINSWEEYEAKVRYINNNEDLRAVRNTYDVALGEDMQATSAVLVKNDNNLLPLAYGTKVYIETSIDGFRDLYKKYLGHYAVVVDTMAEADVVIGDFTSINDVAELFIYDAIDAGKPIVITLNTVKPTNEWVIQSADALLYLSFSQRADHGRQMPDFIPNTEPWVYADLLFGIREPRGMIVKEIARNSDLDAEQWKDLAGDQGASTWVRLMLQATMITSETHTTPENWGDPLIPYKYGMRYNVPGDFEYDVLVLPTVLEFREAQGAGPFGIPAGNVSVQAPAKVNEPYTVHFLLWNHGGADMINVKAYSGDKVVGEKLMAVNGGSWRVVAMDLVFDTPGEHELTIGDLSATVVVQ